MDESLKKPKKKPRGRPFAKGQPGGPGRPEGSKNRSNLNLWLGQIWDDIGDVDLIDRNIKRIEICKWAVISILAKVNNLPATSEEAKANVDRLLDGFDMPSIMPSGAQTFDSSGGNGANGNTA